MLKPLLCCLAAMLAVGFAGAQPQVDLSALGTLDAGPHTQVLVLGTVHLSGAPKGFDPATLEPLLDRLAAFKPQLITVEQISGEACDLMVRHPSVYEADDVRRFCADTATTKAATGLDVPAAIGEQQRLLKAWPDKPTAVQRRHLAAVFLAANDGISAVVQWLQLPVAERHAGDGLDAALVAQLERLNSRNNESVQIAARLAARLGLQRVFAVDDHTGDNIEASDDPVYWKTIQKAWDGAAPAMRPMREKEDALWKSGDMLALYRHVNDPDVLRAEIRSDFGAALGDTSPQHYGQFYVAGWETRNLRMVANVHAVFRESPGARLLAIVGSSHKPWFDGYLGQMQGVEIMDVEQWLK